MGVLYCLGVASVSPVLYKTSFYVYTGNISYFAHSKQIRMQELAEPKVNLRQPVVCTPQPQSARESQRRRRRNNYARVRPFRKSTSTPSWREDVRTIPAAHDDLLDQLAVVHVESPIEKGFLVLVPMKIEYPPEQLLEQVAVWDATLDSKSARQSVETIARETQPNVLCSESKIRYL